MTRFAPRLTRPMCWRKPCLSSSRLWRPRRTGSPNLRQPRSRAPGRARNTEVSLAIWASPFSAAVRPLLRRGRTLIRRLINAQRLRRREAMRRKGLKAAIPRRPRRAIRRNLAHGASLSSLRAAGLPAECSFDRDGRGRRRRSWQSARRPVWRPRRRQSLWRRGKRSRVRRCGSYRQQSDRDDRDQQLLRRPAAIEAAATQTLIRAHPTSTILTTRPSTIRTGRPLTTAAATTTSEDWIRFRRAARRARCASPFLF